MELVEGEDLSQRIARGAMPVEAVLRVALQIVRGLGTAIMHGGATALFVWQALGGMEVGSIWGHVNSRFKTPANAAIATRDQRRAG